MIRKATEERITQVLMTHRERKRGRPAGWSQQMRQALAEVSEPLQRVSEAQIQDTIAAYRATRRGQAHTPTRP
jgi:hypothetical protein